MCITVRPPKEKICNTFLNVIKFVGTSNADDKKILWKFINRFHKDLKTQDNKILDNLTQYAINYFKDKVEPNKKFKTK